MCVAWGKWEGVQWARCVLQGGRRDAALQVCVAWGRCVECSVADVCCRGEGGLQCSRCVCCKGGVCSVPDVVHGGGRGGDVVFQVLHGKVGGTQCSRCCMERGRGRTRCPKCCTGVGGNAVPRSCGRGTCSVPDVAGGGGCSLPGVCCGVVGGGGTERLADSPSSRDVLSVLSPSVARGDSAPPPAARGGRGEGEKEREKERLPGPAPLPTAGSYWAAPLSLGGFLAPHWPGRSPLLFPTPRGCPGVSPWRGAERERGTGPAAGWGGSLCGGARSLGLSGVVPPEGEGQALRRGQKS